MKKSIPIILISILIITGIAWFVINHNRIPPITEMTYRENPAATALYQQMNAQGKFNPYIIDAAEFDENALEAILIGTEQCHFESEYSPAFNPECVSIQALGWFAEQIENLKDSQISQACLNLAHHPNERIRVNNFNFVVLILAEQPEMLYEYVNEQDSERINYTLYQLLHTSELFGRDGFNTLLWHPLTTAFKKKLAESSTNPLLRAMALEENKTVEDIIAKISNDSDGTEIFLADQFSPQGVQLATTLETEATFQLFSKCKLKEEDLTFDGNCPGFTPFQQIMQSRYFDPSNTRIPQILRYAAKSTNPIVRGSVYAYMVSIYPNLPESALFHEKDEHAIATYIQLTSRYMANNPALTFSYQLLKEDRDERIRKLVFDNMQNSDFSTEIFEQKLAAIQSCPSEDLQCPAFMAYRNWLMGIGELDVEKQLELAPILEKHYPSEHELTNLVIASMLYPLAYEKKTAQPFSKYAEDARKIKSPMLHSGIITIMSAMASSHEEMKRDATLKAFLTDLADNAEPQDKARLKGLLEATF